MGVVGEPRVRIPVTSPPVQLVAPPTPAAEAMPEMGFCWEKLDVDVSAAIPGNYPNWMSISDDHIYGYFEGSSNTIERWEFPSFTNQQTVYTYPTTNPSYGPDRTFPSYAPIIACLDGKVWWTRSERYDAGGFSRTRQVIEGGSVSAVPITNPTVLWRDPTESQAAAAGLDYDETYCITANPVTHTLFAFRYRGDLARALDWSELVEINPQNGALTVRANLGYYGGSYPNYSGRVFEYYGLTVDSSGGVWATAWLFGRNSGRVWHYDPQTQTGLLSPYNLESWSGPSFFVGTGRGTLLYIESYEMAGWWGFRYEDSTFEVFYDRTKVGEPDPGPFLKVRRNCLGYKYPLAMAIFRVGGGEEEAEDKLGVWMGDGPSLVRPDFSEIYWLRDRYHGNSLDQYSLGKLTTIVDAIPGGATPATAGDIGVWGAGGTSELLPRRT